MTNCITTLDKENGDMELNVVDHEKKLKQLMTRNVLYSNLNTLNVLTFKVLERICSVWNALMYYLCAIHTEGMYVCHVSKWFQFICNYICNNNNNNTT